MTDEVDELLQELGIEYPPCGFYVGDGWFPIVAQTLRYMVDAGWDRKLGQVKSKFCTLRIYLDGETNDKIEVLIRDAEQACNYACEQCGKPHGLNTPRGGIALCKACDKTYQRKPYKP